MTHTTKRVRTLQKPRNTLYYYLTDSWLLKIISVDNTRGKQKAHYFLCENLSGVKVKRNNLSDFRSVMCSTKIHVVLVNLDSDVRQ